MRGAVGLANEGGGVCDVVGGVTGVLSILDTGCRCALDPMNLIDGVLASCIDILLMRVCMSIN